MKKLTTLIGVLAAFVVALLVVPIGTAGAATPQSVKTNIGDVTIAPNGDAITVKLRDAVFVPNKASNEVKVVNSRGGVIEAVPLAVRSGNGQNVRLTSVLSADRRTATFTPRPP